jgi:[acyl-carrier-protein] S-malonyltransferase
MRIGLIFAGQGAQYPGMGKSLSDSSRAAEKIFELAGEDVREHCFNGSKELLRQTNVTQPAIFTVTMAAYEAFMEGLAKIEAYKKGDIVIAAISGFSLGEYAALTASSSIDSFQKGLEIVSRRGNLMDKAGRSPDGQPLGGMVATFGNREDILLCVEAARQGGMLSGVNFNSPIQTVVAGDFQALERFMELGKEKRLKSKMLSVSTAFHSPLMEGASEQLEELLKTMDLKEPLAKVYSNLTGRDLMEGFHKDKESVSEYLAELMGKQAHSPVYWQEIIEAMAKEGIDYFIEIGPGVTLSGLTKKIIPDVNTLNVENQESLEKTLEVLSHPL